MKIHLSEGAVTAKISLLEARQLQQGYQLSLETALPGTAPLLWTLCCTDGSAPLALDQTHLQVGKNILQDELSGCPSGRPSKKGITVQLDGLVVALQIDLKDFTRQKNFAQQGNVEKKSL